MAANEQMVPLGQALKALMEQCDLGRSGSMYLYTSDGHGAVFGVHEGKISNIAYRTTKGMQSLGFIKQIPAAKYIFKLETVTDPKIDHSLASNDEIFRQLGVDCSQVAKRKQKKILVVEDSKLARKVIVQILKEQGYTIVEAVDGLDALEKLSEGRPDLVLLDLVLPKKDGYEVLHDMKKTEGYTDIPVIVLTSRDTLFAKLKGKMSGTDEYLTKPIKPAMLLSKIEKYL